MSFDKMPLAERGHYNLARKVYFFFFFVRKIAVVTNLDPAKPEMFNR